MKRKKKLTIAEKRERQREYTRKWLAKNPDYFKDYYNENPDIVLNCVKKYQQTAKGRAATKRAESKPERREYKRIKMQEYRARKKKMEAKKK